MTGLKNFFIAYEEMNGAGFYLGKDWVFNGRKKVQDCLIATRITRSVVHKAITEKTQIIVSVYPPLFIHSSKQKIAPWEQEVLSLLLKNKIAVFSLGRQWLITEGGGFDYFLGSLDFQYKQPLEECHQTLGRVGERKREITLEELLTIIIQFTKENCRYLGYNKQPIKRLAIVEELTELESVTELISKKKLDCIITGELFYELMLALRQQKSCAIILVGKHALENVLLRKMQRLLLEARCLEQGKLLLFKQNALGVQFPPKTS